MSESIRITTLDGAFSAYVARPSVEPAPVIVVLHEVFGVNSDMRATCHELADRGYIAVCPDLFWRREQFRSQDLQLPGLQPRLRSSHGCSL
jgi:carboxymethylenebutenolidase